MSSARDNRQRAAARARLEREMAERAEAARRKRMRNAYLGAGVAVVAVIGLVVWIVAATSDGGSQPVANPSAGPAQCDWTSDFDTSASPAPSLPPGIKDVGLPPTQPPQRGFQVVTFDTTQGVIKMEMDLSATPCTAASIAYLANKKFYDNTTCHRLVPQIFALQCGDPSGTGSGGATYRFADENLPKDKLPAYHAGDVAMANTGQPGSNGSQFFFLWDNSTLQGDYSLFGKVIEGLDVVKKIGAGGDDGAFEQGGAGGGHPKIAIKFNTVRAGPVTETSSVPAVTATPPASPAATSPAASASATPTPAP